MGGVVLDRVVRAVMALMHLGGGAAERQPEHLMAEADTEHRQARLDQLFDFRHGIGAGRRRIAGAVGQKHAVRLALENLLGTRRGRHHGQPAAQAGQLAQDVALQPIIDGDDMKARRLLPAISLAPPPPGLVRAVALAAGDVLGEVEADHAGPSGGLALQRGEIELAVWRVRDDRVRHALVADQRGESARIHTADGDDAARRKPRIEVLRRPIIGRLGDLAPQHAAAHAAGRQAPGLHVLGVGADIADMGKGEGDDLPGIRRIGQDLLIAGHGGVEAHLADRDADRARALAFEHGAVGKNQKPGRRLVGPRGDRRAQGCGLCGRSFIGVGHLLL